MLLSYFVRSIKDVAIYRPSSSGTPVNSSSVTPVNSSSVIPANSSLGPRVSRPLGIVGNNLPGPSSLSPQGYINPWKTRVGSPLNPANPSPDTSVTRASETRPISSTTRVKVPKDLRHELERLNLGRANHLHLFWSNEAARCVANGSPYENDKLASLYDKVRLASLENYNFDTDLMLGA